MNKIIAQNQYDIGQPISGLGKLGNSAGAQFKLAKFLSSTIGLLTVIAGIWFLISIAIGGAGIATSGGDKQAYESAKQKITNGAIGLVIVISAIFIMDLVANILGVPKILDIGDMITLLSPK